MAGQLAGSKMALTYKQNFGGVVDITQALVGHFSLKTRNNRWVSLDLANNVHTVSIFTSLTSPVETWEDG